MTTNGNNHEATAPDSDFDELFTIDDSVIAATSIIDNTISLDVTKEETDLLGLQEIPFTRIYEKPVKFKAVQRAVFIPGAEIEVNIIDHERSLTTHLLNPNLYTIEFKHGDFTWTVKKRYKHIQNLHQQLKIFRTGLNIPFPSRAHRERRTSFKMHRSAPGGQGALPRFPNKPEALVQYENIELRMRQLEEYLRNLLCLKLFRNHHETVTFMEVSHLSFVHGLGIKGKESLIQKRTGSTQPGRAGCNFCGLLDTGVCVRCHHLSIDLCASYRHRWLVVKETWLGYVRPNDGVVKCVMLFDSGFEVSSGFRHTGQGLHIRNLSRQIFVKCWTKRKRKEWMAYLKEVANNQARDFTQINKHHSFCPERSNVLAGWFVDGASYMAAVADGLNLAREEIYIADWWLSPEIYMKRTIDDTGDRWRIDEILHRKAEEGVKVFILLYKEVELALGINSYYSKQRLASRHENIKVLRHPDHAKAGVFFWAHHEKLVVIDQSMAFVGGIDICYGRWDTHKHRLTDLGQVSPTHALGQFLPSSHKQTSSQPMVGSNPSNSILHLARATNLVGVGVVSSSNADEAVEENTKCDTPKTRRRNLLAKMKEKTERGKDWINKKFNPDEEEEEAKKEGEKADAKNWVKKLLEESDGEGHDTDNRDTEIVGTETEQKRLERVPKGLVICLKEGKGKKGNATYFKTERVASMTGTIEETLSESSTAPGTPKIPEEVDTVDSLSKVQKLWIGKDYTNFIVKDFTNLDLPYVDLVDRGTTPRMPWHDIGAVVHGSAARDVARHFIQRWNAAKLEKARLNPIYPNLLPKSYADAANGPVTSGKNVFNVDCQVTRSASAWSTGFLDADETWEESIHEAYIAVIGAAKHYVYIENQFFISLVSQSSSVKNQIAESLYKRIIRAHKEKTTFRVYVVMPLLPGFEGEVGQATGTALHAITHWNYASISRGKDAILNRLVEAGIKKPHDYISFYGLRNHSMLNDELVSELIYVHSKLLIADDNVVICGSANINDRSLVGKRDSEVAVVVTDREFVDSHMNGQPYKAGKYAGSLRTHLFKEHLGLLGGVRSDIDVTDPVCDDFYHHVWTKTAQCNTDLYEKVFHCIPTDTVSTFAKLKKYQEEFSLSRTDPIAAKRKVKGIHGHLVNLPLNFLKDEVLTPNPGSAAGIMPTSLWT